MGDMRLNCLDFPQVKIGLSGRWMAYTLQSGSGEACSGHVNDLASGQRLAAGELPAAVSVEWLQDGSSLAYTLPDVDGRPHKVTLISARIRHAMDVENVLRRLGDLLITQWTCCPCMQVMLRHLGTEEADVCLLAEPDQQRFLELSRTKDGAYVAINSNSKTDSEVCSLLQPCN